MTDIVRVVVADKVVISPINIIEAGRILQVEVGQDHRCVEGAQTSLAVLTEVIGIAADI